MEETEDEGKNDEEIEKQQEKDSCFLCFFL